MGWFHFAFSFQAKNTGRNIPKEVWGVNYSAEECACGCGSVDSLVVYDDWSKEAHSLKCWASAWDNNLVEY